jgi:hypothetical protein
MQVLWKNHPTDKTKNGTREHIAREAATTAVTFGWCEIVRYASYVDRLSQEAPTGSDKHNVTPPTPTLGWGIDQKQDGAVVYIIEVRASGETVRYELGQETLAINNGCPQSVLEQAARFRGAPDAAAVGAAQLATAKQQADEYNEKSKFFRKW